MKNQRFSIDELLAMRDGDLIDAAALAQLDEAGQAERYERINELHDLRRELRSMPDIPVDDAIWIHHAKSARRSAWLSFPLATAASVFVASVLGIYLLGGYLSGSEPQQTQRIAEAIEVDPAGSLVASLMRQSKDLERRLQSSSTLLAVADGGANAPLPRVTPIERNLMYRLADIDAQIAGLYETPQIEEAARLALWRKRVEVLQSIVAVRSERAPAMFDDSRSM